VCEEHLRKKIGSRILFGVLMRVCCQWAEEQMGKTYANSDFRGRGKIIYISKLKFLYNQISTIVIFFR
jgi:hypothetical protein